MEILPEEVGEPITIQTANPSRPFVFTTLADAAGGITLRMVQVGRPPAEAVNITFDFADTDALIANLQRARARAAELVRDVDAATLDAAQRAVERSLGL